MCATSISHGAHGYLAARLSGSTRGAPLTRAPRLGCARANFCHAPRLSFSVFFIYNKYSIYIVFIQLLIQMLIQIAEQYTKHIDHTCIITENISRIIIYIHRAEYHGSSYIYIYIERNRVASSNITLQTKECLITNTCSIHCLNIT